MITNPVYSREMKSSSRSIKLSIILAVFNLILAVFAIASMAATINRARIDAQIDYAAFLTIFRYVATIEFALILFIMPSLTAGSISGERERGTLDLMLTTKLSPMDIVTGKILTGMSNVAIVLVSSLPVLALVFVYGGVTVWDIIILMICFLTIALVTAAIGVFASSICGRSSAATALSYGGVLLLTGGTIGINVIAYNLAGSAGRWYYLLLANPAVTFYSAVNAMTGNSNAIDDLAYYLGTTINLTAKVLVAVGMAVQVIIGVVLILLAIRNLYPKKNR